MFGVKLIVWVQCYLAMTLPEYIFSGGGIGGLTLAAYLSRSPDILVDIYETKPQTVLSVQGLRCERDLGKCWKILGSRKIPPKEGFRRPEMAKVGIRSDALLRKDAE
jgi:2-polyprenyl-6-methoxyphenol hydroxylase-like FAD-dependent oxidoreductase